MKISFKLILTLACIGSSLAHAAQVKDSILIQTNYVSNDDDIGNRVIDMVFNDLPIGGSLTVVEGNYGGEVARFVVPKGLQYDSIAKRKRLFKTAMLDYMTWFKNCDRSGTYALNIPVALEAAVENVKKTTNVLIYGSVIHRNGLFSFRKYDQVGEKSTYWYPNDAMIATSVNDCIWGTKEKKNVLENIRLHFFYPQHTCPHEGLARRLKRFYSLWSNAQGGKTLTFVNDEKRIMRFMRDVDKEPYEYEIASGHHEPMMIEFAPHETLKFKKSDAEQRAETPRKLEDYEMLEGTDVTAGNGSSSDVAKAVIQSLSVESWKDEVGIALAWDGPVDFDLVVYNRQQSEVPLYFGNKTAKWGALSKR